MAKGTALLDWSIPRKGVNLTLAEDSIKHASAFTPDEISSVKIDAHRSGTALWIDMFEVPRDSRGKGLGSAAFRDFIRKLPKDIQSIWIVASDTGSGQTDTFWESLGFEYAYPNDGDDEDYHTMKLVLDKVKKATAEPWHSSSYAKYTELVPIAELKRYCEYNRLLPSQARSDDPEAEIDAMAESIKQEGIREPLILEYSESTGLALLTEGNHRIIAAERAGLSHVPVRGYRRHGPFRGANKGVRPPETHWEKDKWGDEYIPQDFKPSMIGVGGTTRTAEDREAVSTKINKSSTSVYYHVSRSANRQGILEEGLKPQNVEELGVTRDPGVYLFDNKEAADQWAEDASSLYTTLGQPNTVDIWEVRLPETIRLYPDEAPDMSEDGSWYTPNPIPASSIELLGTVGEDSWSGKTASPDFGYSQFNDRDNDLTQIIWKTFTDNFVTTIRAYPSDAKVFTEEPPDGRVNWIASIGIAPSSIPNSMHVVSVGLCDEKDTQWRGTGLGQMLYEKAIEYAKSLGMRRLYAGAQSPDARRAWDRLKKRYSVKVDEATRGKVSYVDLEATAKTATEQDQIEEAASFTDEDSFLAHHNTGYIQSDAYENYEKDGGLDWEKLEAFPVLLRKVTLKDGTSVELRQSGRQLNYTKWVDGDSGREIARGSDGLALHLSPEEVEAKGYPARDTTIAAFTEEGKTVGLASDEFGADGVWVVKSYQGKGLGTILLTEFRKQFGKGRRIGQMTPAGKAMTRSYYNALKGKKEAKVDRNLPPMLYHGTPLKNLESIRKVGLQPSKSQSSSKAIYLSDDEFTAANYSGMHGGDFIVLGVDTSYLDISKLSSDDYELPELWEEAVPKRVRDKFGDDPYAASWQVSLKYVHQVAYLGTIPPEAIRDIPQKKWAKGLPAHIKKADGPTQDQNYDDSITQTPAFKAWFGESKVVDDHGRPLRVYHGTKADFDVFEERGGVVTTIFGSESVQRNGLFFSDSSAFAEGFAMAGGGAGGNVMPCYLSLQNPANFINDYTLQERLTEEKGWNWRYFISREMWEFFDGEDGAKLVSDLKSLGYDGAIISESIEGEHSVDYVVFNPHQVKSAIGNSGGFNPIDPRITASKGKQASAPITTAAGAEQLIRSVDHENEMVLFHSSTADANDSILSNGLEPRFGDWVRETLDGATDDQELIEQIANDSKPIVYLDRVPRWVISKIRQLPGFKGQVSLEDIRNLGQLTIVVVSKDAKIKRYLGDDGGDPYVEDLRGETQNFWGSDKYFGLEPGDYFSDGYIEASATLVGDELVKFLEGHFPQYLKAGNPEDPLDDREDVGDWERERTHNIPDSLRKQGHNISGTEDDELTESGSMVTASTYLKIPLSGKPSKTAYISPRNAVISLSVDIGSRPVATLTLDLGIPNFTVFSIKIPIEGIEIEDVKYFIEQAFEAMLDEVSAFLLTMKYPEEEIIGIYKLALNCLNGMSVEDASDYGTDADDNIRFYEAEFEIPDSFVEQTLSKVVTATADGSPNGEFSTEDHRITASATRRLPPIRHWEFTTLKPHKDDPAKTIQMYRSRSLKTTPRPYYLMLYDRQGRGVGVTKIPRLWEERLTKAL